MRTVSLAALVVVPSCVINPPSQQIEATWTIQRLDGTVVGCGGEWNSTVLVTDGAGQRTTDRFACDHGGGVSTRLPVGTRTAWLEFMTADDRVIATSLARGVEIQTGLVSSLDETIYVDAGYVSASWTWPGERWCDSSTFNPFQAIHVTFTPSVGTHVFSCHDDGGITAPIPTGRYSVSIGQGFDSQDLPDIVVDAPNSLVVLPPVVL